MIRIVPRLALFFGVIGTLLVLAALRLARYLPSGEIAYALGQGYGFQSYGGASTSDLYLIDLRFAAQVNFTHTSDRDESNPVWSPDGSRIAYFQQAANTGGLLICVFDTQSTCYRGTGAVSALRWTPDGSKLAYLGEDYALYALDLASGASQRYNVDVRPGYWGWSPDGSRFIVTYHNGSFDNTDCCEVDLANGDLSGLRVVYRGNLRITSAPSWSPDGHQLVFMATDGVDPPYIYALDTDSGDVRLLSRFSDRPAWSPTDMQIAFISDRSGYHALYLMDADGKHQHAVVDAGVWSELEFIWAPDGKHILFMGDQQSIGDNIYILDLDSEHVEQFPSGGGRKTQFTWRP